MRNSALKILCLLLMLSFGFGSAFAQYDLERPSRIIDTNEGLPNYYIRGLLADSYGFMWVGSYDGLSRFDGKQIKVFRHQADDSTSLAHSGVVGMAADPNNGKVWVCTYNGLSVYQPESNNFKSYFHDEADSFSLPANFVSWVYADRQSELWLSTRSPADFLCRFDPERESFDRYRPEKLPNNEAGANERIRAFTQDLSNDSILWIGSDLRFLRFNKYKLEFEYDLPDFPNIVQIFPHTDGKLYLRNEDGVVKIYDPLKNEIVRELQPKEDWRLGRIFRKSDQSLWFNSNRGVAELDLANFQFSYPWIDDKEQGKNYDIDFVDRHNRIWSAGTDGIKIYDPLTTQFQNYFYEAQTPSRPYIAQRVIEDKPGKQLYLNVSSGDGLYRFDLKTRNWTLIPKPADYGANTFYGADLAWLQNGELLILESTEIFTLTPDGRNMTLHPVTAHLPEETNWRNIFVDSRGYIWLGGRTTGVLKIRPETWEVERLEERFPGCNEVRIRWVFYEDSRNNIWISNCDGFGVYSYQQDQFYLFSHSENPQNSFKTVKDFIEDQKGRLWISSEMDAELGLVDLDRLEEGIYRKLSIREEVRKGTIKVKKGGTDGDLIVSKMAVDPENNIWTISSEGLLKFNADEKSIEIYNERDGLQWLDADLNVVTVNQIEGLSTGELVVGFRKGLSVFDPLQLTFSQEKPKPYLTSFKVYNNEWAADSSLLFTRRINLGYEENYFSFEFSSIGYTYPEKYRYQYKLAGVDKEWIHSGQRSYAAYTNVRGGDYTFMIKAANSDGVWNEKDPLIVRLHVATPWWRSLWFQGGLLFLILAGGYAFYRYRLRQARKAERLKTDFENRLSKVELTALRAQMSPHFIFNCLNSIESYILKNETRKASDYLNDFSRLIRLILQNSRSNYVNLKDEIEALTLYMEMEQLRFNQRFEYKVNIGKAVDLEGTEIPPMLIQPYIENAIWHGLMHKEGQGKITLNLSIEEDYLKCVVEDNGVGRQKAAELRPKSRTRKSMGMNITRERIDIINKLYDTDTSVKVTDLVAPDGEAAGTRVELRVLI